MSDSKPVSDSAPAKTGREVKSLAGASLTKDVAAKIYTLCLELGQSRISANW